MNFWQRLKAGYNAIRAGDVFLKGRKTIWDWISTNFSSKPVTEKSSLGLAAFWSGVRLISEGVATLPIDIKRRNGMMREEYSHPISYTLNSRFNPNLSAVYGKQIIAANALMQGNGYGLISRQKGAKHEIYPIHPDRVSIKVEEDDDATYEIFYVVEIDEKRSLMVSQMDMIHIRGFGTDPIMGFSLFDYARTVLGLAISAQDYGLEYYQKGTRVDGYLKYPGTLDEPTKDSIANHWRSNYGPNGKRQIAILDGGTEYTPISVNNKDSQFIETRGFQALDIARLLRVPPHKIAILDNATFSNIEEQNTEYVNDGLMIWLKKFEEEFEYKLLSEKEKDGNVYIKFNTNALLRGDIESRSQFYEVMRRTGVYSINDIRELEDMNPVEGGDMRSVDLNTIPLSKWEKYFDMLIESKTNGTQNT